MAKQIVLASNNLGKLREFDELFNHHLSRGLHLHLVPQSHFQLAEAEETGCTFVENALIKARHAANLTGLPALADDSGLTVPALGGAPGVRSARYAGEQATASDNLTKLLHDLIDVPDAERQASFHCIIVYLTAANDPTPLIAYGKWDGWLLRTPQGEHGFGYDPIFYLPALKQTAASMPSATKNQISHRALALQSLLRQWLDKS